MDCRECSLKAGNQ